tara:strand:- start:273 stop:500 length:228 start_codon:yes stop_codon:yes gene_type:complete
MKKTFLIFILSLIFQSNIFAEENCKDLPGFKKLGKGSVEYTKCIAKKGKELGKKGIKKLNTDSKLTDWIKKQMNK